MSELRMSGACRIGWHEDCQISILCTCNCHLTKEVKGNLIWSGTELNMIVVLIEWFRLLDSIVIMVNVKIVKGCLNIVNEYSNQDGICARIGCNNQGHLSQRLGSSMFSYRMIVCD